MINYNVLYHIMFIAVTDALRLLEQGKTADAMIILALHSNTVKNST